MSMKLMDVKDVNGKSEYIVEFECYSKFRICFEDISDLTRVEIVRKAAELSNQSFTREGILITERIARDHSYSFTALGIDSTTANILNQPKLNTSYLKLIK